MITVVWGLAFLAEAAAQVVIIESASAGVAKTTANLLPLAVAGVVAAWTAGYGRRSQRRGELAARAAATGAAALAAGAGAATTPAADASGQPAS